MPAHLLSLDDDALMAIMFRVVSADPAYAQDVLLTCNRLRSILLAAATSATITSDTCPLLQHCRALRGLTLIGCNRLPWAVDAHDGAPSHIAPPHGHLSSLTNIDAGDAPLVHSELSKLLCLPNLTRLRVRNGVTGSALVQLAAITSLRHLNLAGCTHLAADDLAPLCHLTFLDSLDLSGSLLPADDCITPVTTLTALTELNFRPALRPETLCVTESGLSHLASLTSLRSLDLRCIVPGMGSVELGLSHLTALRCLEQLDLSTNVLSAEALAFLPALMRLHTLRLGTFIFDDVNGALAYVSGLMSISQLDFNNMALNDDGIAHLRRLRAITALDLDGCRDITEAGFAHLSNLSSLRYIDVSHVPQVPVAVMVSHLAGLRQLHEVHMDDMDDEALAQLCKLSTLTMLNLSMGYGDRVTAQGLEHLSGLLALEELDLRERDVDLNHVFRHASQLTALTQLEFDRGLVAHVTDDGLVHLSALHKLQALNLEGGEQLTDRGLACLSGLSSLTRLSLRGCSSIARLPLPSESNGRLRFLVLHGCSAIINSSLVPLSGLRALEHLCVCACVQLTDAGVARVWDLTTLTSLHLSGCKRVSGASLQQLSRLRALKALQLGECCVEEQTLAALGRLRSLSYLDLSRCAHVTDRAVSHLTALGRLGELHLARVPLTSAGLECVARILSLTCLGLSDCEHLDDESMLHLTSLVCLSWLNVSDPLVPAASAHLQGLKNLRIN